MLLIFPRPPAEEVESTAYTSLAINFQAYDEISVVKNEITGMFELQLVKVCIM